MIFLDALNLHADLSPLTHGTYAMVLCMVIPAALVYVFVKTIGKCIPTPIAGLLIAGAIFAGMAGFFKYGIHMFF